MRLVGFYPGIVHAWLGKYTNDKHKWTIEKKLILRKFVHIVGILVDSAVGTFHFSTSLQCCKYVCMKYASQIT